MSEFSIKTFSISKCFRPIFSYVITSICRFCHKDILRLGIFYQCLVDSNDLVNNLFLKTLNHQ